MSSRTEGGAKDRDARRTRALPQIVGPIIILIGFCGGLGFMISHVLDPLTAYLATSPGGLAIIAAAAQHLLRHGAAIGPLPRRAAGRTERGAAGGAKSEGIELRLQKDLRRCHMNGPQSARGR